MVNIVHKVLNSNVDKVEDNVLSDNDRQNLRNVKHKSLKFTELYAYMLYVLLESNNQSLLKFLVGYTRL